MADDIPDTQTQTQSSEIEWSQPILPLIPKFWGRLYPFKASSKTLGINRNPLGESSLILSDHIDLTAPTFKVGRALESDLQISKGNVKEELLPSISKDHFMITRDICEQFSPAILHDFSRHGTYVNGRLVGNGKKCVIENNDEISLTHPKFKILVFMDLIVIESTNVPLEVSRKYFVSKSLGAGACGVVKLVYNKMTCEKFAMKIIVKKRLTNGRKSPMSDPDKIMNEVSILKALKHPCIISTEEVLDTPEAVYIVLELMEGGELFDRVSHAGKLTERTSKLIFRQIVLAVKYLHDQGIAHRDLKPENVLLGSNEVETLVKLTDFGLSKFIGEESFMKTMCGTPLYVAPEVLLSEGRSSYDLQVDVWSLGVILFICLSGYLPFSHEYKGTPLHEQIIKGNYLYSRKHWEGVSLQARKLMLKMLTVNPEKRISLDNILKDQWMQDEGVINKVNELMQESHQAANTRELSELSFTSSRPVAVKRVLSDEGKVSDPPVKKRRMFVGVDISTSNIMPTTAIPSEDTSRNLTGDAILCVGNSDDVQ